MKPLTSKIVTWFTKSHPLMLSIATSVLAAELVIITVFLSLGYSFAIYDNVKPDWEAIGTVFSFISAIGAIGAAILIPWQISQKQNRITLFTEKYDIYKKCSNFLDHWGEYANLIINSESNEKRLFICVYSIEGFLGKGDHAEILVKNHLKSELVPHEMLTSMRDIKAEGVFTFDKASYIFICLSDSDTSKITKTFSAFFDSLRKSICNKKLESDLINKCSEFKDQMDSFKEKKLIERMKNEIGKIET